jgi:hypothetical protein
MPGFSVVDSGNYDLLVDVGFLVDSFTLDSALKGVLDNTTYVLDGTTAFASVMDGTIGVSVKRGRRDQGDQFAAGQMSFTLNDTLAQGVFNPFDDSPTNPYYDQAQGVPGLAPMRQVKLIRYDATNTAQSLFQGYIVNYDYNFALGGLDTVTVYCVDRFYLLAQTIMDELNVTAETSGERIETVLDLPEVDYPGGAARNIDTGTVDLGHDSAYTVPAGTNVLAYLGQINQAEQGRLFIDRSGVLVFQPRVGTTLSAPIAAFHDDGTNIPYNELGISFEADQVVNRAVVTGLDGKTSTADDPASQAAYFIQTESIGNSLLHIQGQIDDLADYLLEPQPEPRFTAVGTDFLMLTSGQRDTLATVDIGDTITIEKTIAVNQIAQELSIEGIEHELSVLRGHLIMYFTSPTTIVYELILDDPIYGELDALNVLG